MAAPPGRPALLAGACHCTASGLRLLRLFLRLGGGLAQPEEIHGGDRDHGDGADQHGPIAHLCFSLRKDQVVRDRTSTKYRTRIAAVRKIVAVVTGWVIGYGWGG